MSKTEFFSSSVFFVAIAISIPYILIHAQEAGEVPADTPAVVSEAELPETDVPQDTSLEEKPIHEEPVVGDVGVIKDVLPERNEDFIFSETATEGLPDTSPLPGQIETVLEPDSLLVRTQASSSQNKDLPFELTSEDMSFAINEIPSFTFVYKKSEDRSGPIGDFVTDVVDSLTETVHHLYEGSIIETVVDTVTETFSTIVDFLVPTAEGQEPEVVTEVSPESVTIRDVVESVLIEGGDEIQGSTPVDTEILEVETASSATPVIVETTIDPEGRDTDIVVDTDILSISKSLAKNATNSMQTETISALPVSFAIVDGISVPIQVTLIDDDSFGFTFIEGVFDVGPHALELHIILRGVSHTAYYIFTIEGTVITFKPLTENLFAVVVRDAIGAQTLWLEETASGTVRSFDKIADESSMLKNPVLEFKAGILFWTGPTLEVLMGFDVVSKSFFSQTLNTQHNQENVIELQSGEYDVQVNLDVIQVEFVPEDVRI